MFADISAIGRRESGEGREHRVFSLLNCINTLLHQNSLVILANMTSQESRVEVRLKYGGLLAVDKTQTGCCVLWEVCSHPQSYVIRL